MPNENKETWVVYKGASWFSYTYPGMVVEIYTRDYHGMYVQLDRVGFRVFFVRK